MKKVTEALSGFLLSLPAAGIICLAFYSNREPGSWILLGIVLVLGFPWNIVALALTAFIYLIYINLCAHIIFLPCAQIHPYYLLFFWFSISGVMGAHVNGYSIVASLKDRKANAID